MVSFASAANTSSYVSLSSDAYSAFDVGDGTLSIEGGFSVFEGTAHYWTSSGGYSTVDLSTGTITNIGQPSTYSNGYGDPFGYYDDATNCFYAGTYNGAGDSYVYTYSYATHSWSSPIEMVNIYSGAMYNGNLYISGLREPWTGGYDDSYISLCDLSGNGYHDALIETGGASAHLTLANNGDIYYAYYSTSGTSELYRWTAEQVAGVVNDLANGDEDTFLTLADGEKLSDLPGGGNGITIDDAGNVFITTNAYPDSSLLLWNGETGDGNNYDIIATNPDSTFGWFGPMDIEGDFLEGATLYGSYSYYGPITAITYDTIPEPVTLCVLAAGAALAVLKKRRNA